MADLDGVCIGFVGEIRPVKLFTDSGKLVGLFPDTIHVVIENFFYMKFPNDILPRRRSVNDDGINVLILENASIFKNKDVDTVVVYASSPWQYVIGEFHIEKILNDNVDRIWEQTHEFSGISEKFYRTYFAHKTNAYAIKIGHVTKYKRGKRLSDYNVNFAPQSYVYL